MRQPSLYLTYISDDIVEFDAFFDSNHRRVSVQHGRFPNTFTDAGESFGDTQIDVEVERRANEELVRYRATKHGYAA